LADAGEGLPGAVLFACLQNAVRSPMAEGLMRHFYGTKVFVLSAGVRVDETDAFAIEVMDEIGIDISKHVPTDFDDLYDSSFDLIVSLTPEAHHKALELTRTMAVECEYWPTFDPSLASGSREQILETYRTIRDQLSKRIRDRFGGLGAPVV
jgi:protein-tyrosine-phosphatase